jgi:hypothetical protein
MFALPNWLVKLEYITKLDNAASCTYTGVWRNMVALPPPHGERLFTHKVCGKKPLLFYRPQISAA